MKHSVETDIFSEIAERVDQDRRMQDLCTERNQLGRDTNMMLVRLGEQLVASGVDTPDILIEKVWATVARHRELTKAIGVAMIGPEMPRERERKFYIRSKPVRIAGDLALTLCQAGTLSRSNAEGFWQLLQDSGTECALDQHACPETTLVGAIDIKSQKHVYNTSLQPRESRYYYDEHFAEEWGGSMFPFSKIPALRSPASDGNNWWHQGLTAKELIIGAGYDARFNLFLDEIEANL